VNRRYEIEIVGIDGSPKQVIVTDATECNPQKLKKTKTKKLKPNVYLGN
jgi:hypothetical protein